MDVEVKLDRITVTGHAYDRFDLLDFARQHGWTVKNLPDQTYAVYERFFGDSGKENLAVLMPNPYKEGSWRVDTSNHLTAKELKDVSVVSRSLREGHLTRIDVAFDFINGPYQPMKHVIMRPRANETGIYETEYRDASRRLQSLYSGHRSSNKMYRLYNKLIEQKKHNVVVPDNVKRWERWEIQLRGDKSYEWLKSAKEMLSQIKYPLYESIKSPSDRATLYAIDHGVIDFKDFGKEKAARLQSVRKNSLGYSSEYADAANAKLVANASQIDEQVRNFLGKLEN